MLILGGLVRIPWPLRRAGRLFLYALCVLIAVLVALAVWHQGGIRGGSEPLVEEARTLALTYDAVRMAPKAFWDKPVLWRLGCRSYRPTTCYYEGDAGKPVLLPEGSEVSYDGHKGMSYCLALGRIKLVDSQGVYLELLQTQGTRE
jgi:hypothetical protein